MSERKPYFFLYADDFLSGVLGMPDEHVGVYVKLLCLSWSKGGISDREAESVTRDDSAIQSVLREKFYRDDEGKWRNHKLEKVRLFSQKQSQNGAKPKAKSKPKSKPNPEPHIHIQNHIQSTEPDPDPPPKEIEVDKSTSCSEASESLAEPPLMLFPVKGPKAAPKEWPLTKSRVSEYRSLYPTVNIALECRKARQWLIDNPSRRKTAQGMPRFLTSWMCRVSDRISCQREKDQIIEQANAHKPAKMTPDTARFQLIKTFGIKEARDWSDKEVMDNYMAEIAKAGK